MADQTAGQSRRIGMATGFSILDNIQVQGHQHFEQAIDQMRLLMQRVGARDATVMRALDMMFGQVLEYLEVIESQCAERLALAIQEDINVAEAAATAAPAGWQTQPPQPPGSLFMFNDNVRGVNHD